MENKQKKLCSIQQPYIDTKQQDINQINILALINQLKEYGQTSKQKLKFIIQKAQSIFINQPNVLKISNPIRIVGDIHGQFYDLLHILQKFGNIPKDKFLFLGDYVDRGLFCIQVITLLLAFKCIYPEQIYLLRGNHQGKTMTQNFNFKLECAKKYNIDIYQRFLQLFCKFPICAVVDKKYFCVHGGISPLFKKINLLEQLDQIERFKEIQNAGLICDLLWSDPSNNSSVYWEKNKIRSCSYYYSKSQAQKFVQQNKIQMIIRGHQVQTQGYAYQLSDYRKKLTLTIFSAPNYCDTYKNKGGIIIINKNNLMIETFTQSPHPFVFPNYLNMFQCSLPLIATKTNQMFLHLIKTMQVNTKPLSQQQLNTLHKIQCLHKLLEGKKQLNFSLLINLQQITYKEGTIQYESQFTQKKINDKCQKYPQIIIGPKSIEFIKIQLRNRQEDQPEFNPIQSKVFQE